MAKEETLYLNVDSNVGEVTKDVEKLDGATKKASGGFKGIGTAVKGVGVALKAAGIGLIVAIFAKLFQLFSQNQKVLDAFSIANKAISIAFRDMFKLLSDNVGKVTGWFKDLFEDPKQKLVDFGDAIKENLIERFNSFLETIGFLGEAFVKLINRDFAGAMEAAKNAGGEFVDTLTGVDNTVGKVTKVIVEGTGKLVDYGKATLDTATDMNELDKAAGRATVTFAKQNAQFLKDAEDQRKIRDDVNKTFAERITANEKLGQILLDQEAAQLKQLKTVQSQAQAQFDLTGLEEDYLLLQEAKVAIIENEEAVRAQASEQLTNQVALENELAEAIRQVNVESLSGMERELEELKNSYDAKIDLARKAGMDDAAITEQYEKDKDAIRGKYSKKAKKWSEMSSEQQLAIASSTAGDLATILGEETAAGKAAAIVQATIDTYASAQAAYKSLAGIPVVGPALGGIAAAAAIAGGIKNIAAIKSASESGAAGGGGGAPSASAQPPAPQMMSGAFDLSGGVAPEPVKAFVVTDEMTNSQNQLANIRRRSTI
jgi:hypothetical protein